MNVCINLPPFVSYDFYDDIDKLLAVKQFVFRTAKETVLLIDMLSQI